MLSEKKIKELKKFAAEIRVATMEQFKARGFGHVGGSLSIVDVLAVLYGEVLSINPEQPKWEERDRFVLSKGHAGPAYYATLCLKGYFPREELKTLNQPGTILPSHPDRNKTPGVDMSTGSLGQGVSQALGLALGFKLLGKNNRVYVIAGDGESNEGQVWEAALFAPQKRIDNLVLFIDYNKKQLDGYTKDICDIGNVEEKFSTFGWYVQRINGHDIVSIYDAIDRTRQVSDKPSVIVLDTVKGKGVPFIEEKLLNHHITVSAEEAEEAIKLIKGQLDKEMQQ